MTYDPNRNLPGFDPNNDLRMDRSWIFGGIIALILIVGVAFWLATSNNSQLASNINNPSPSNSSTTTAPTNSPPSPAPRR
jgi:hypothetical protein